MAQEPSKAIILHTFGGPIETSCLDWDPFLWNKPARATSLQANHVRLAPAQYLQQLPN